MTGSNNNELSPLNFYTMHIEKTQEGIMSRIEAVAANLEKCMRETAELQQRIDRIKWGIVSHKIWRTISDYIDNTGAAPEPSMN